MTDDPAEAPRRLRTRLWLAYGLVLAVCCVIVQMRVQKFWDEHLEGDPMREERGAHPVIAWGEESDRRQWVLPWIDPARLQYEASRPLAANHRLVPKDLRIPDDLPGAARWRLEDRTSLVGKYLVKPACEGDAIAAGSVTAAPSPLRDPTREIFSIPLEDRGGVERWADVGDSVRACQASECSASAELLAIDCGPEKCFAVLAQKPCEDCADLFAASGAILRIRPSNSRQDCPDPT